MIAIMTLLVLSLLQVLLLYTKASNQLALKNAKLYQLEAVAARIIHDDFKLKCSAIYTDDANVAALELHTKTSCSTIFDGHKYFYTLANLDVYPCLIIRSDGLNYASYHSLISISSAEERSAVLQVRIAAPSDISICKPELQSVIAQGIMSWRYLDLGQEK